MPFDIASYIDHSILKPTTMDSDVERLCNEAISYRFAAVYVPPYFISKAVSLLKGTNVRVATVIGFPFGYSSTTSKKEEIKNAIADGAHELDIVHNLAALKNSNYAYLDKEAEACIRMAHDAGRHIKVIIESGVLTDDEIIRCCELYAKHGADYIKTSTGYAETGATIHAVQLMRRHLPSKVAIKASGGIRNFAFAKELIDAGATRLGCSAGIQIAEEGKMAR